MTDIFAGLERIMAMSDEVWERHANKWSVYSRMLSLPILALAVWSRVWIGGWAWVAVAVVLAWIWINPRIFPKPLSLDNWASQVVLGERVFLSRRAEVAAHHRAWSRGLALAALPGVVVLAVGLWRLDLAWTVFGVTFAMGAKLWFADRMVWLYQDWRRSYGKEIGDV